MDIGPMIWVSALVPVLVTVAIILILRKTLTGNSPKKQEQAMQLTQTGRKARATILRVEPTGMVVNNINLQCWVTFRLQPLDGGPITEGRKKMLINQTQMPRAGDVWPAWMDPVDPQTFAVGMPQGADPAQIPLFREFGIAHPLDGQQSPTGDTVDDLQRLVEMKQLGLLTDDEFQAAKTKLLRGS
jgi:hypothetical protein